MEKAGRSICSGPRVFFRLRGEGAFGMPPQPLELIGHFGGCACAGHRLDRSLPPLELEPALLASAQLLTAPRTENCSTTGSSPLPSRAPSSLRPAAASAIMQAISLQDLMPDVELPAGRHAHSVTHAQACLELTLQLTFRSWALVRVDSDSVEAAQRAFDATK